MKMANRNSEMLKTNISVNKIFYNYNTLFLLFEYEKKKNNHDRKNKNLYLLVEHFTNVSSHQLFVNIK